MTDDRIVTDGGEVVSQPRKSVGSSVWFLIGLGLGIGVSFLVGGSAFQPINPPVTVGSTTTVAEATFGVGDVVLGFPDNLSVVVSPGAGRALEVVTWPVQGVATFRSVALSDLNTLGTPRFDSSGHFLAAMVDTGGGALLSAGRPNSFEIVASDISGFAWHDDNAADLAWSKLVENELQIWVSEDSGEGQMVASEPGLGGSLTAYGDWGFAVAQGAGVSSGDTTTYQTHMFDISGQLTATIDGRLVATHNSGLVVIEANSALFLLGPNGETPLDSSPLEGGVAVGGAFSPDADKVALTGLIGVAVIDLTSDSAVDTYSIRAGSDSIAWSSDGRFILVSSFRGVAVVDTRSGDMSVLLEDQTTRAVAVAPIGSP